MMYFLNAYFDFFPISKDYYNSRHLWFFGCLRTSAGQFVQIDLALICSINSWALPVSSSFWLAAPSRFPATVFLFMVCCGLKH